MTTAETTKQMETMPFATSDYRRGYVCVAPDKRCSPQITVAEAGVWFKATEDSENWSSAHMSCLFPPRDADEKQRLERTAQYVWSNHTSHGDKLSRDNCGACALQKQTKDKAPGYAGWVRLYIQLGYPIYRHHYDAEMAEARTEYPAYYAAAMRDVATWGVNFQ